MYNIMDKRSKVNSQLSDKVYDVTLDDIDTPDFEFNSDLYKVNIFGKNVHIAPGRPKKDKTYTGLMYFYVYVVKDETVVSKLGVYEKMTTENREIYDLTEFPDGSLLLFDAFYNMPALIDDFETEEELEEEEEEVQEVKEEMVKIDGKDYSIKGTEVFDTAGKKVGNTITNGKEVEWLWNKNESPSPQYVAASKIYRIGNVIPSNVKASNESPPGTNMFDYLTENISKLNKKITQETQNKKTIALNVKLRENTTIEPSKKEKYLSIINLMTKARTSIYDRAFIENVKQIANTNNEILSYEEQVMFILYIIGSYINVMFEFKNKNNDDNDYDEIKQLNFIQTPTGILVCQIKDRNVYFIEKIGTSLNTQMAKKAALPELALPKEVLPKEAVPKTPDSVNLDAENVLQPANQGLSLNEPPSPPFIVNTGTPSPPFRLNNEPAEGAGVKIGGGKIKRGGVNTIKLK